VILVVAATPEELRGAEGGSALVCGVGPVEAAARTAVAVSGATRLKGVLNVGIAGSRDFDAPAFAIGSEAV
jgi:futalosine hydrolase